MNPAVPSGPEKERSALPADGQGLAAFSGTRRRPVGGAIGGADEAIDELDVVDRALLVTLGAAGDVSSLHTPGTFPRGTFPRRGGGMQALARAKPGGVKNQKQRVEGDVLPHRTWNPTRSTHL
jgi:hypothetical protein